MNDDLLNILNKLVFYDKQNLPYIRLYGIAEDCPIFRKLLRFDRDDRPYIPIFLKQPECEAKRTLEIYLN